MYIEETPRSFAGFFDSTESRRRNVLLAMMLVLRNYATQASAKAWCHPPSITCVSSVMGRADKFISPGSCRATVH